MIRAAALILAGLAASPALAQVNVSDQNTAIGWQNYSSVTDSNGNTVRYVKADHQRAVVFLFHGGTQPAVDLSLDIEYRQFVFDLINAGISVVIPESTNTTTYSWSSQPYYDNVNKCGTNTGCTNLDVTNLTDLLNNKLNGVIGSSPVWFHGFSDGGYHVALLGEGIGAFTGHSGGVQGYASYDSMGHYCIVPGGIENTNDSCSAPVSWTKPYFYRVANNDTSGVNSVSTCNPTTSSSRSVCRTNLQIKTQQTTLAGLGAATGFVTNYQRVMAGNYLIKPTYGAGQLAASDEATILADMQNAAVVGTPYLDGNNNWIADPLTVVGIGGTPPTYPTYSGQQSRNIYTEALVAYGEHRFSAEADQDFITFLLGHCSC